VEQAFQRASALMSPVRGRSNCSLPNLLQEELSSSRARTVDCWPERGRPDPVRQHCMLGGQLSLEVSSMPLPRAQAVCTCICAMPLGWDATRGAAHGGVSVEFEMLALGYANGHVELLFNLEDGVLLMLRPSLAACVPLNPLMFIIL
jgi:hypothetical protein